MNIDCFYIFMIGGVLALAAASLIAGAVVAPCLYATRRRRALALNICGLLLFLASAAFLSNMVPRHPDDPTFLEEALPFVLQLSTFFLVVEGIVYLLHWRWSLWRAGRKPADS